jgi:hypothetical protein
MHLNFDIPIARKELLKDLKPTKGICIFIDIS